MEKLFSYGTLQMDNVQKETFGRLLAGTKDVVLGYVLSEVIIKDRAIIEKSGTDVHPVLQFTGQDVDEVAGTVFDITADELSQADEYEVDDYQRVAVTLKSGGTAWVYAAVERQG